MGAAPTGTSTAGPGSASSTSPPSQPQSPPGAPQPAPSAAWSTAPAGAAAVGRFAAAGAGAFSTAPFIRVAYTSSGRTPRAVSASAFAISSSIVCWKTSMDCAPTILRPLTKNVGVPVTPSASASASSRASAAVRARPRPLPARDVEAGLAREPHEALLVERARAREELVVHRPELALLVGGDRRERGGAGVRVDGQRVLAHDGAELRPVGLAELRDERVGAAAEGALVVRERDEGDRGARVADRGRAVDGHAVDGGVRGARGRRAGALLAGRAVAPSCERDEERCGERRR